MTHKLKIFWKYKALFLMMIPGIAYLLINNYLPMFGIFVAFKNVNFAKGLLGSDWVGFQNFEYLFKTSDAYIITRNTLLYNGTFIIIDLIFAVSIAIILNEVRKKFFARFYQSVILLPYLMSSVVISYLVYAFLSGNGYMNSVILPMLDKDPIPWYSLSQYWPYILTFTHLWKSIGYSCIIYLAAIVGIDQEYYEAATIDGASKLRQITSITIPLLMPVIIFLTLLGIGKIFYSDFGLFYQIPLDSGAIQDTTNVIDTYVYRSLINLGDIGMSSAAGLYQSLVGFILVLVTNLIVRRFSKENALF